jgi:hypothetical protein
MKINAKQVETVLKQELEQLKKQKSEKKPDNTAEKELFLYQKKICYKERVDKINKKIESLKNLHCTTHPESDFFEYGRRSSVLDAYVCEGCVKDQFKKADDKRALLALDELGIIIRSVGGTVVYDCPTCGFHTKGARGESYEYHGGVLCGGGGVHYYCKNCNAFLYDDAHWRS